MENRISWVSLWPAFFEEGVEATLRSLRYKHRELPSAISAIILTRTSWEAFSNELIEQRGLDDSTKRLHTTEKISRIYSALEGRDIVPENHEIWSNLVLITALRNAAVHFDTRPRQVSESPRDITKRLSYIGVIQSINGREWERQVYCTKVAIWCCRQIGKAIETLERLQGQQFRPPETVSMQIDRLLAPLKEVKHA